MALDFPTDDNGWTAYVEATLKQHGTDIQRLWKRTSQLPAEWAGVAHLSYGQQLYGSTTGSRSTTTTVDGTTTSTPDGWTTTTPIGQTTTTTPAGTTTTAAPTTTTTVNCIYAGVCYWVGSFAAKVDQWTLVGSSDYWCGIGNGCGCLPPGYAPLYEGMNATTPCAPVSSTTTTTTAPPPCSGECTYQAMIVFGTTVSYYWQQVATSCAGQTPCNCGAPVGSPTYSGEIQVVSCSGAATTTTPPNTTTTCGTCANTCRYMWVIHDTNIGYWWYLDGVCPGGCYCNPPTQGGGFPGQIVESPCRNCTTSQSCIGDCKWTCRRAPTGAWSATLLSTTCSPGTGASNVDCRCVYPDAPSQCLYEGQHITTGCFNVTP